MPHPRETGTELSFSIPISSKRAEGSLGEMTDSRTETGTYRMAPKHHLAPQSKDVLR